MNDLLSSLTSPGWWFTAVFMALLVNIISAYLKPRIDASLASRSAARQQRLQEESAQEADLVAWLARDAEGRSDARHRVTRLQSSAVLFGVFATQSYAVAVFAQSAYLAFNRHWAPALFMGLMILLAGVCQVLMLTSIRRAGRAAARLHAAVEMRQRLMWEEKARGDAG